MRINNKDSDSVSYTRRLRPHTPHNFLIKEGVLARQVRLMLHGREFVVHTLADETHLERVAQYVNSKCQEAERSLLSKSQTSIFALAAALLRATTEP